MIIRYLSVTTLVVGLQACSFSYMARGPDEYREATRTVLDTRRDQIKSCYDQRLETNETASGVVVVHFKVEPETGQIVQPHIDQEATTAPEALGNCVIQALDGLAIDPPDAREGQATFSWEFAPRQTQAT